MRCVSPGEALTHSLRTWFFFSGGDLGRRRKIHLVKSVLRGGAALVPERRPNLSIRDLRLAEF